MKRRNMIALLVVLFVGSARVPAKAEPVPFSPADLLVGTFDLQGVFPFPFGTPDVIGVSVLLDRLEPFGSFTIRLFDGDEPLGVYSSTRGGDAGPGLDWVTAHFVGPTSIFSFGDPTVIDMTPFADGSIDGVIHFAIAGGLANLRAGRAGGFELFIGQAAGPSLAHGISLIPDSPLSPVPEPTSLLLVATAGGGLLLRAVRRRQTAGSLHG